MQPSLKLKLSIEQQGHLKEHAGDMSALLSTIISANAEQIGYLLQAYHPREKVRRVEVIPDSVEWKEKTVVLFNITYTLEEFNACSAVDTEDRKQMPVSIAIDQDSGAVNLIGEYWPEA